MMKLALPSLLAATVALTGCGGFAGTSPDGVGPLAAPAPLVPAAPADATFRLTGVASLNDRAFAGASLRLFDVLTDEEFVLSDRSQSLAGAGGIVSTSNGGFDVETFIPGLIPNGAGGLISNQAGGLISNQAGGLISNQAGGLISNQAGGLISNQAGGLISNQAG
ncbi:MAG: hypothetical protein VKS61_00895, partial [Candidatus Sericytochromatia bacterium]|nr:hypothetical protein [Candidatus Sericytochromatia bacterium]